MAAKTENNLPGEKMRATSQITYFEAGSAVAKTSNHLGINLYKLLAKENRNVFFSPFSISTALFMLFCGARNETADEMREVLGYEGANIQDGELKLCYRLLLDVMDSQEYFTLNHANAVLSGKVFPVKNEYKALVGHFFKAFLKEVDFENERHDAVELVNEWVQEKTNNMIPAMVHFLDPLTPLIILTAVYFKGYWLHPFKEKFTKPQDFYNNGDRNDCKKVDMMHKAGKFSYAEMESYKALGLLYRGSIAMLILLPNSEDGLSELENSLSSTFIQDMKQSMSEEKLDVALLKFKFNYSTSLNENLQSLGLKRVFNPGAHLDGISDSNEIFLSEVNHTAILVMHEEGTEAAAATFLHLVGFAQEVKRTEFIVDHPFMFVIYDKGNNLILFMGRVNEL